MALTMRRIPISTLAFLVTGMLMSISTYIFAQPSETFLVVPSDELDKFWVATKIEAPEYPKRALAKFEEGCVAMGFFIQSDGTPSGHNPIAVYPSNDFNRSALKAAKRFRFEPSEQNPERQPVLTFRTFTYEIVDGKSTNDQKRKKLETICTDVANETLNKYATGGDAPTGAQAATSESGIRQ